jgi:hypothetical protein
VTTRIFSRIYQAAKVSFLYHRHLNFDIQMIQLNFHHNWDNSNTGPIKTNNQINPYATSTGSFFFGIVFTKTTIKHLRADKLKVTIFLKQWTNQTKCIQYLLVHSVTLWRFIWVSLKGSRYRPNRSLQFVIMLYSKQFSWNSDDPIFPKVIQPNKPIEEDNKV